MNPAVDPYGNPYFEPGKCPACGAPERRGGMRAGSYIPFTCGASRRPRGSRRDGWLSYDDSTGAECLSARASVEWPATRSDVAAWLRAIPQDPCSPASLADLLDGREISGARE